MRLRPALAAAAFAIICTLGLPHAARASEIVYQSLSNCYFSAMGESCGSLIVQDPGFNLGTPFSLTNDTLLEEIDLWGRDMMAFSILKLENQRVIRDMFGFPIILFDLAPVANVGPVDTTFTPFGQTTDGLSYGAYTLTLQSPLFLRAGGNYLLDYGGSSIDGAPGPIVIINPSSGLPADAYILEPPGDAAPLVLRGEAVPEPSALVLLGNGLLALALSRRRRGRSGH